MGQCRMGLGVMVFFLCWQGKKLVFKFGKAGIGSRGFVGLHLRGRVRWLRLWSGRRGGLKRLRCRRNLFRRRRAVVGRHGCGVKKLVGQLWQFGMVWLVGLVWHST